MYPPARPRFDQCLGGVLDALDEVLGSVADAVMGVRLVGLDGHVGRANQQTSMSCGRITVELLRPQ
jgi:hypothetical protein